MVDDINKHTCGLDKNESFYHQNRKINISQYEKIVSMTQNNKTPKQILEELKDPITKEAPVTAKDIYNIRYKLSKLSEVSIT
ncbi:hypothetical protein BJ944DRAFT_269052 [Cunninghamella echinulata]|nr:hypothetical protein BJ944DRAFT_269052 [Cunninghamella echinulata]